MPLIQDMTFLEPPLVSESLPSLTTAGVSSCTQACMKCADVLPSMAAQQGLGWQLLRSRSSQKHARLQSHLHASQALHLLMQLKKDLAERPQCS